MAKNETQRPHTEPDSRIVKQTAWLGALAATQLFGGLAQVVIAVRILGPEGYGTLAVIIAASSMIHGVLSTPGGHTVITYVSRSVAGGRPTEAANTFRFALATSLGFGVVAYGALVVLALLATEWLELEPEHFDATLAFGVTGILLAVHSETLAILRLAERAALAFYATFVSSLVHVAALLAVWSVNGGLLGVVAAAVAAAAVNGVLLFALAALSLRSVGAAGLLESLGVTVPRDVVKFHVGVFGTATVTHLRDNIDTLLVAHFAGAAETGLYRAARQLVDTARAPFAPIGRSLQVEFSKQWHAFDGSALRSTARRYTLVIVSAALVGFGTLAALSEPVVGLVYGAAFAQVVPLLLIMIPGSFVVSCFVGVSTLPHATGRAGPVFVAHATALATSSLVLLVLVPPYGATGGAWAFLIFGVTWGAVLSPYVVDILRRSYDRRSDVSRDSAPTSPK